MYRPWEGTSVGGNVGVGRSFDVRAAGWDKAEDYADFLAAVLKELQDGDLDWVYDIWWYPNRRYPQQLLRHRPALAERAVSESRLRGRARACDLERQRFVGPGHATRSRIAP